MSDKPIIFSAESVRAILAGGKTQTRRVIKPQPTLPYLWYGIINGYQAWTDNAQQGEKGNREERRCPYAVGDRLWVRESWLPDPPQDGSWDYYGFTDGEIYNFDALPKRFKKPEHVIYKASWNGIDLRWRSLIHMPRWASRLTLEVVSVRVERVQEISEADAIAEGIRPIKVKGVLGQIKTMYEVPGLLGTYADGQTDTRVCHSAVDGYSELWDHLNAKRGYPWAANPWVWVYGFKVAQP